MKRATRAIVLAAMTAVSYVTTASAGSIAGIQWSAAVVGCTPDETTTAAQSYRLHGGAAKHKPGNTEFLAFFCSVHLPPNIADAYSLELTYRDSTGAGTGAFVRAKLYRVSRIDGSTALLAVASSDSAAAVTTIATVQTTFTHTYDIQDNIYFVRVEMDRNATTQDVAAFSVQLRATVF